MNLALRSMIALATGLAPVAAMVPTSAIAQEKGYAALEKLPDWSGVWQPDWSGLFGTTPPKPPTLTPAAKKVQDEFNAKKAKGENLQHEQANCIPPGVPGIMRQPYPIEFIFSPGRVTLLHETYSQVRRFYTDGRKLPDDPDPAFNGSSVAHWEGDTLVVETIGFNPVTSLMEAIHPTEKTRMVERFHLTGPDTLTVDSEISDPDVFVGTFARTINYARHRDWQIREYVCEENNRDKADEFGRPSMNIDKDK
jgi:hypothetical protein